MFQKTDWQFESVDDLAAAREKSRQSIGVVVPREIISVKVEAQPDDQRQTFEEKKAAIQQLYQADREQLRLFEESMPDEMKGLAFRSNRIHVHWKCGSGKTHNMQIMDWEAIEFQRRFGDEEAVKKIRTVLDLETYATKFFLGNLKQHPNRFTIVGLWYPKRKARQGLFD